MKYFLPNMIFPSGIMILDRPILQSEIGIDKPNRIVEYSKKFEDAVVFIRKNTSECMSSHNIDIKAKICKEMFDYIIKEDVFRHTRFNENCKFRAIVWNKLFEFDQNIPGPWNPKDWIPDTKKKLSFLGVICDTTKKNGPTNWDLIP